MQRLFGALILASLALLAFARTDGPTDEDLKKKPITTARGELGDLLRKWYKEGTAAGNVGDWYDNRDGELTGGELGGLALWRDENRNGVSEPGEVVPANVHGVVSLSVRGETTRPGLMTARNGVRFDNGRARPLYDWTPGRDATPVS